ncbi:MAG: GntR family transcriptional regulator, partial [Propionicimonas sp.]|nr:GntR family transcriptional regulator [Propionicimonas sp.]
MASALQPVRLVREALGQQVASYLRDAIVRGDLAGGHKLVEAELAETLDVSRGPVRDALRILEAEGLVAKRGQSVTVLSLDESDIEELYTLRGAIEALAVRISLERPKAPDLTPLRESLDAMRQAADDRDTTAFTQADFTFHSALCDISGHRRATAVWHQFEPITKALLHATASADRNLQQTADQHQFLY